MEALWVGIDIAKATFTASNWNAATQSCNYLGEFENTTTGCEQLQQQLTVCQQSEQPLHVVLESTGGYEQTVVAFAFKQQWGVCIPNAKIVRDFARGSGRRHKNDREDANMLARFGAEKTPTAQRALPAEIQQLQQLQQRRQQLEKLLRAERTRLLQFEQLPLQSDFVGDSIHAVMAALQSQLDAVVAAISALLNDFAEHKAMVKRLRTIPGVGSKNSLPIFLLLHRFAARTNDQGTRKGIVAFCGLDPLEHSSGRSVHKRPTISKMGDRSVRNYLYMGALGGIRGNNALRHFYHSLVNRGKAKRLALVASARKILVWAFAIFTSKTDFDPSKHPLPQSAS